MQIGELIARFEDEAVATEALIGLGDIVLTSEVSRAAAAKKMTIGEFAATAVQRFANRATDEDWLTLLGRMSRADDPGQIFLRFILSAAIAEDGGGRHSHSPTITMRS